MKNYKKIAFYSLLLATALLSWDLIYGNIAIGIVTSFSLFTIIKDKTHTQFLTTKFIASTALFFVYFLGVFYSKDQNYGFSFVETTASLLVFPIIFLGIHLSKKQIITVVLTFILSYTLRSFYALFGLGVSVLNSDIHKNWYFQEISELGGFQPAYMGLFSVVSMLLLLFLYVKKKSIWVIFTDVNSKTRLKQSRVLYILLFIFHLFFLVILATRMAFISLLIVAIIFSIYIYKKEKENRRIIVIGGVLFFIVAGAFLSQNNSFKFKLHQLKNINGFQYNKYDASSVSSRIAKWKSAINIGKEHLLLGVGTGDLPEEMMKQFYKIDCLSCKVQKYNNPHNQYLDSFARNGILGVLSLLFLLGYSLYIAIKSKNIYYFMFIAMFSIMILSECLFNREKGVEIFAFFNAFYLYYLKDE